MNQKDPNFPKAGDVVARRYVVLRHLREEPCGEVWLAQDRSLGIDVGLKFVPRRLSQFEAVREILRREGALAFKLRHPHILQVAHFEEGEEGVYLIQEPFSGESLLAHLNRLERFRLPYALGLLEQVSQALAFAHLHQEVHHSLDPSHVLLEDQTVKLANFACPKQEGEEAQQVTHIELKAYIAPEVIQGEVVTPAANVFSLGVLGFRLTAGSLPYALTFDEPFPYRLESIPVDLEEIPLPLQNLFLQCLAPDPQDRFEDAGAFLANLEQRRESWSTPAAFKWFSWTPERQQQASGIMEFISRTWGKLWEGSKSAAGRITEEFKSLKVTETPKPHWWLIGLIGGVLALMILFWGGRTLLRRITQHTEAPQASAPVVPPATPQKATQPKVEAPPSQAATRPASPPRQTEIAPSQAPSPPRTKGAEAAKPSTAQGDRFQLMVVTYRTYDEALAMKKRILAKGLPAMVYRVTVEKKPLFVVKAGPFNEKKRAEEVARRLKAEERLGEDPKIITIKAAALKTSPKKSRP